MTLINIRNFEHKEVVFLKDMTYMYGPNGSGKTTVLNSIYYSLTQNLKKLNQIDFQEI
jgi:recombinational DNA repair ATPase RecF